MDNRIPAILAIVALSLAGCGTGAWPGGLGWPGDDGPLERVLVAADDTPGNQSLLYTAMVEAEAAAQSAGRGVAAADDLAEVKGAVGDVLYAVDPAAAPGWSARRSGIVPGWAGKGYGVRRAVAGMAAEVRPVAGRFGGEARRALVCIDNTRERADQLVALGRRALETEDVERLEGILTELERLARGLNEGLDRDGDEVVAIAAGECGLEQARGILRAIRARARAG